MINMDSHWFSALFEGSYDDVINNIADYVNYGNSSVNDGDSSGNQSPDDDDDDDASDEEGELFWEREFDHQKLVICTAGALALYYNTCVCVCVYIRNLVWICTTLECNGCTKYYMDIGPAV